MKLFSVIITTPLRLPSSGLIKLSGGLLICVLPRPPGIAPHVTKSNGRQQPLCEFFFSNLIAARYL
jgi:hypothetical protein